MEAILVIPTAEAMEAFKHFDADLDDSPDPIPAYGLASNISFEVPLEGTPPSASRHPPGASRSHAATWGAWHIMTLEPKAPTHAPLLSRTPWSIPMHASGGCRGVHAAEAASQPLFGPAPARAATQNGVLDDSRVWPLQSLNLFRAQPAVLQQAPRSAATGT